MDTFDVTEELQPPLDQPPPAGEVVTPDPPSASALDEDDPTDEESPVGDEPDESAETKTRAMTMPAMIMMPTAANAKTTMRQVIRGGRLLRRTILTMDQA